MSPIEKYLTDYIHDYTPLLKEDISELQNDFAQAKIDRLSWHYPVSFCTLTEF